MRFFFWIISFLGGFLAWASEYQIPSSLRFTIEREEGSSPIVYYFSPPSSGEETYPILLLCDGSSGKGDLKSVFFIREWFADRIASLNVGYLTIEKWGIDGNQINESDFWSHYSRSQRLEDHLKVIQQLEKNPPQGWNGKWVFVGVSEGGILVTDLCAVCPNTLAAINWVGAGDWGWADEFWQFFENWKQHSFWLRFYNAVPRWAPFSSDIPPSREEYDLLVSEIIKDPSPNKWMGGMTYFYHADAFVKKPIDYTQIRCPFLVVKGTEESDIGSCDQFVQKAQQLGVLITYFRVEGMDHSLRKRPDVVDFSFDWLKELLSYNGNK